MQGLGKFTAAGDGLGKFTAVGEALIKFIAEGEGIGSFRQGVSSFRQCIGNLVVKGQVENLTAHWTGAYTTPLHL